MSRERAVIHAITGASGAPYARRLVQVLAASGVRVHLTMSSAGARVLLEELGIRADPAQFDPRLFDVESDLVTYHRPEDVGASIASGSFGASAMVVLPCSMGTVARIVHGVSSNLIERAADVMLKERKKLVLVPRETPLSSIHLKNLLAATRAGAVVLPAMPGFYHRPTTLEELVDFVVTKVLDQLGVPSDLIRRWGKAPGR
ncbi:MAG: UbiX family flavin prenyltransferase [Planctomycetes bacterium]|nr:UbiX family flavin prenyltransferase [Planctomycetota bacterium]MBI3847940.1 UbiX family flavin prenyltransferase [Planctomycetota bacterium]